MKMGKRNYVNSVLFSQAWNSLENNFKKQCILHRHIKIFKTNIKHNKTKDSQNNPKQNEVNTTGGIIKLPLYLDTTELWVILYCIAIGGY